MMPPELHDDDVPIAVLEEHFTRGKARAYFTRERGIPFTEGAISLVWFKRAEYGVGAPSDVWACAPDAPGATAYWYFNEGG